MESSNKYLLDNNGKTLYITSKSKLLANKKTLRRTSKVIRPFYLERKPNAERFL